MLDLAEGLQHLGCQNHVIHSALRTDSTFGNRLRQLQCSGVHQVPMRRMPHWSDWQAKNLIANYILEQGPFDIIHGHSSKAGGLTRMNGIARAAKVVYTPNGIYTMNPSNGRAAHTVARWVEKWLAKRSSAIIAVSPEERDHMLKIGLPPDRIHLIANGLRPIDWPDRSETRHRLGIPRDVLTIGFLGRLAPQKNPLLMVTAFALLQPPDDRPLRLLMVGTGPLENEARKLAQQLGIADRVDWLGYQAARDSMPAFDIFVMPSCYEGMPYVLMEAVSAGIPAVAAQVGGVSLSIDDGSNGFVVPPGNPTALAGAVQKLVDQPNLRAEFAAAGRKKSGQFAVEKMIATTLELYWSLLNSPELK